MFDPYFTRNIIIVLIITTITALIGYALSIFINYMNNLEINKEDYHKIVQLGKEEPKLLPMITKAMEDNKITSREFFDIRNESLKLFSDTESIKTELRNITNR
jgi:hypothetical protein